MAMIGESVGRGDLSFARGTTFQWVVRWRRSGDGGKTYTPVDLSGWQVRLLILSPRGETWLDKPAIATDMNGLATVGLDAADTSGDLWRGRLSGTWQVLASQPDGEALSARWEATQDASDSLLESTPDMGSGTVKLLAWGYWRCG